MKFAVITKNKTYEVAPLPELHSRRQYTVVISLIILLVGLNYVLWGPPRASEIIQVDVPVAKMSVVPASATPDQQIPLNNPAVSHTTAAVSKEHGKKPPLQGLEKKAKRGANKRQIEKADISITGAVGVGENAAVSAYLKKYAPLAVAEMRKHGIPASITLAQAIVESNVGKSTLAVRNNNHFGIKCHSRNCRPGHCTNQTDDHHKDFFRKYSSVADSYKNHSAFLKHPRYKECFAHKKNYKEWAKELQRNGYATDKTYAAKLVATIEKHNLGRFDK